MTDELKVHDVNRALLAVTATYVSAGIVATVIIGPRSDRLVWRRVFDACMAVDQAVVTWVLSDAESRAKDFGIMNIGQAHGGRSAQPAS